LPQARQQCPWIKTDCLRDLKKFDHIESAFAQKSRLAGAAVDLRHDTTLRIKLLAAAQVFVDYVQVLPGVADARQAAKQAGLMRLTFSLGSLGRSGHLSTQSDTSVSQEGNFGVFVGLLEVSATFWMLGGGDLILGIDRPEPCLISPAVQTDPMTRRATKANNGRTRMVSSRILQTIEGDSPDQSRTGVHWNSPDDIRSGVNVLTFRTFLQSRPGVQMAFEPTHPVGEADARAKLALMPLDLGIISVKNHLHARTPLSCSSPIHARILLYATCDVVDKATMDSNSSRMRRFDRTMRVSGPTWDQCTTLTP
jgi:hypothetical protein